LVRLESFSLRFYVHAIMNLSHSIIAFGVVLLVAAVGLMWFGLATNNPSPVTALGALGLSIISFVSGIYVLSAGLRGVKNVQSVSLLKQIGTYVLMVGIIASLYATLAFFVIRELPPNNEQSRLPSLYLLFAAMATMFVGAAVRNF
jgi:hypothetical protein